MGYEVIYSYHEKVDGDYNKDEVKTIKKRLEIHSRMCL